MDAASSIDPPTDAVALLLQRGVVTQAQVEECLAGVPAGDGAEVVRRLVRVLTRYIVRAVKNGPPDPEPDEIR